MWSCHGAITAVDRVASRRDGISLTRLPCSAHRLIPSIDSAPGFGDWPGPLHNFASSGPLSPGFDAMIRQPVAQNLKLCPCIQHHTPEIQPGHVLPSLPVHECTSDRISAPRRQRSSPPRTCHTHVVPFVQAVPPSLAFTAGSMLPSPAPTHRHPRPGLAGTALCAPSRPRVFVAEALALLTGCHHLSSPDNRK